MDKQIRTPTGGRRKPDEKWIGINLRNVIVAVERAAHKGKLAEALQPLKALARERPGTQILISEETGEKGMKAFALLGLCKSITGTTSPAITGVTVTATKLPGSAGAAVTFSYVTAATEPPCIVKVASVTLTIGATVLLVPGVDTRFAGGGGGTWAGSVTPGMGPSTIGAAATVTVVFSMTNTTCDVCNLAPGASLTQTATVTVV